MKNVIGLIAVAGLAAAASAQNVAQLRYETRVGDGAWAAGVQDALPGQRIEVRAVVSYIGTGTTAGLADIIFQPTVSNWTAGDTLLTNSVMGAGGPADGIGPVGPSPAGNVPDAPGVYGRVTPFGSGTAYNTSRYIRGHAQSNGGVNYLRIARNDVTNWIGVGPTSGVNAVNNYSGRGGVQISQGALGTRPTNFPPPINSDQNLVVFKFGFDLGTDGAARTLEISTPEGGIGRILSSGQYVNDVRFFATTSSDAGTIIGGAEVAGAAIRVVPTPASLALMGLGGLMVARRRR